MAIIDGKIKCHRCRELLPLDNFSPSRVKRGSGECRSCMYLAKKNYESNNRDKVNKRAATYRNNKGLEWRRQIKSRVSAEKVKCYNLRRYGITIEQYNMLLEFQDGACAVCKRTENSDGKMLYVDHCHDTGAIRGLLCRKCNTGIGLLGDSVDGIEKALNYLRGSI